MDTQTDRADKLDLLHKVALGFIPDYKRVDTTPVTPNEMTDWIVNMMRLECHLYASRHERVHFDTKGVVKFATMMALIYEIEHDPSHCDALTQAAFEEGLDFVTAVKGVVGVLLTTLGERTAPATYTH